MRIALAQINCTVGDLAGNAERIVRAAEQAKAAGASLMVTPEMALCGYPPEDLLLREGFYRACERALADLASRVRGIALVVGCPRQVGDDRYNAAALIRDGAIAAFYHKRKLPNYTVFDEERYFRRGEAPCVFEHEGLGIGVAICADVWEPEAGGLARAAGARVLLVLNASPYHLHKQLTRHEAVADRVSETGLAVAYCNLVGGQDELVFDGASFVMGGRGDLARQLPAFEEAIGLVDFDGPEPRAGECVPDLAVEATVYRALVLGVRDYVGKNGFPGALIGLSGGVDSALTLAVAADALGADRVRAVMMPSRFTADISLEDARTMAAGLGVHYTEIGIEPMFEAFLAALAEEFRGRAPDTTEENLQARIRGTLMMALSNKFGSIVLTTGNKSEMAVGYATLYGDMAGGFAVIKDLAKTMVYRVCRWRNLQDPVIPERVIARAPSAELRENQTDQDSLPPYELLDAIVEGYMEQDRSVGELVAEGFPEAEVRRVVRLLHVSEYKRRQAPVGIRITPRGFGKDWRYPITNRYRDEF